MEPLFPRRLADFTIPRSLFRVDCWLVGSMPSLACISELPVSTFQTAVDGTARKSDDAFLVERTVLLTTSRDWSSAWLSFLIGPVVARLGVDLDMVIESVSCSFLP